MAKKTKWYTFEGTIKWAKVYEPDEFRGASNWTIDFYPKDEAEKKAITATGIQGRFKEDADGNKFIRFRRSTKRSFDGGKTFTHFAPPVIYDRGGNELLKYTDKDGNDVRSYAEGESLKAVGEPVMIGNGSRVALNIAVYDTAYGPGNRFESVKILDLVEYKKPDRSEDVESDTAEENENVTVDW